MPSSTNSRQAPKIAFFLGALFALPVGGINAQSGTGTSLPPTAPTVVSPANSLPAPIAATPLRPQDAIPRNKARTSYSEGLLHVEANNSSLNGILRDISQLTGMKITGGVTDQRVFGSYGPAAPSTVLATLLDGTGSNMLLKETATNAPAELILTPRTGGPTPPNPAAAYDEAEETAPPPPQNPQDQQIQPQGIPGQAVHARESPSGIVSPMVSSMNPQQSGNTDTSNNASTDPASDSQKTPEQIYQQLQQLRQAVQQQQQQLQQQQQSGGTNSNSSTTPIRQQ